MRIIAVVIFFLIMGGVIVVSIRQMRTGSTQGSKPVPNVLQAPARFPQGTKHDKPDMLMQLFSFA